MISELISEEDIAGLVPVFYGRVRKDPMLGPIFNGAIEDWPEHIEKLRAFWSSVMLGSGRYKGQPMPAPEAAAVIQEKARRIAESLALGIDYYKRRQAEPAVVPD